MKKVVVFLLWISIFISTNSLGQNLTPLWNRDLKTNINWQKVTPIGQLIASTGKGLIGINTVTGEELWALETLKNISADGYQPVPQSPFISLTSNNGDKSIFIIDPLQGKIVFNSKEAGIDKVNDQFFLFESSKILVIGTSLTGKNTEMVMVDMQSGKKQWSKSGAYSFTTGAKDLGKNELIIISAFFASKLNAVTGEEIWKTAIDPKTAGMSNFLGMLEGFAAKNISKEETMAQLITTPFSPDIFMIAANKKNESTKIDSKCAKTVSITYSSVYMAFDIASGKHKWASVIELKNPLGISYASEKGLIVCSSSDGNLNMLNYNDGSKLLGKKGSGLGLKGSAIGAVPLGDGKLLMVSDNGKNSSLTVLDPATGMLTFDKAAKIKGIVSYTELLSNGVLVATDEEVNYLNVSTGTWYSEDGIESNSGLLTGNDQWLYVFNTGDNLLYKMEMNGNTFKPFSTAPIAFQGKEKPKAIELMNDGIVITSDQNIAFINSSGRTVYNQYYPAPGISDFRKALLIASAVRAAYYTAAYATYSAAFGVASQSIAVKDSKSKATKQITGDISQALGNASVTGAGYTMAYIKMAQQRFKATTQSQAFMLVMTSETKKDSKLLQVNKVDGKILNTIQLGKDKEPIYDIDLVDGKLYYMKDASKMECYKF
jgi:hypothetical protein